MLVFKKLKIDLEFENWSVVSDVLSSPCYPSIRHAVGF